MKKYNNIIIAVFLIAMLIPIYSHAASSLKSTNSSDSSDTGHPHIQVSIEFANYTDLDGDDDEYEDDVYAFVEVYLEGSSSYTFDYYITLTLPSGESYSYLYVISTNYDYLGLHNLFYDHAYESGWYQIDLTVVLHNGGEHVDKDSYEFDPPGGGEGYPEFSLE